MKIFYEPVNVNQWNIFEKVKSPGHIEPFLATKSMTVGDLMLLHVGQQDRKYESGVYAVGEIIDTPFILRNHPEDYCNNKETVNVRILNISYTEPLISHEQCITFIHQFRTVHKIDEIYYQMILNLLAASCNGDLLSGQELQIINLMKDLCPDFVLYGFLAKDICKGSLFGGYNIYYKKGVNNSRGMISAKRNIKKYGLDNFPYNFVTSNDINGEKEYGWSGDALIDVLNYLKNFEEKSDNLIDSEIYSLIEGNANSNIKNLIKTFKKNISSAKVKEAELEHLRQSFVHDFNLNKLSKMEKEEYVIGLDSKESFCYRIERELQDYGDMRGANSSKFGLYFGKNGDDTEKKYRSTSRYDDNPDIAIVEIRNQIGCLYLDGLNKNYNAIKDNTLSPMFKGKILAMYFPEDYLCIYSEEHIDHFINKLGIKIDKSAHILDKQIKLIEWKKEHPDISNWSNYIFAVFLYDAFGRPFVSQQARKEIQEERDKEYPKDYVANIGLTISQWKKLLKNSDVFTNDDIELLKRFYMSDNHATTCHDLAIQDGKKPTSYITPVVSLAKRISKASSLEPIYNEEGNQVWWRIPFWGRCREDGKFEWKLRPKLAKALLELYPELETDVDIAIENHEDYELINDLKNINSVVETKEYVAIPKMKDTPIFVDGHKTYPRDRLVSLNALSIADHKCEIDSDHPTFTRRNTGKNYTEPHHLIPLSYSDKFDVSLDVEANIVSLCSNCHNHIHYGQGADNLIVTLYNARKKLLNNAGINITLHELLAMYGYN